MELPLSHARRTFRSRSGSPSLKTWLGQVLPAFGTDVAGAAGTFSPGLKVFGGPSTVDATVLRTRGTWQIRSAVDTLSVEVFQVALGVGLCTTEAALAGAVPLPFDNPDWDGWFIYQVMDLMSGIDGPVAGQGIQEQTQIIDSKAMRKIPSGQVLFLSTQMFTGSGGAGNLFNEIIQVRSLLKTS